VLDVLDVLFVSMFDGLSKDNAGLVETVFSQYPQEPFEYLPKSLRLTFAEGIAMLKEAGIDADPLGDLNTELERKLGKLVKVPPHPPFPRPLNSLARLASRWRACLTTYSPHTRYGCMGWCGTRHFSGVDYLPPTLPLLADSLPPPAARGGKPGGSWVSFAHACGSTQTKAQGACSAVL
jgi:hypothetical protein